MKKEVLIREIEKDLFYASGFIKGTNSFVFPLVVNNVET